MEHAVWNYDAIRERMELSYDDAVYLPENGLPVEEVRVKTRKIYEQDQKNGIPFAVTRAKMLACSLENLRIAVNDFDLFAGIIQRNFLSGRYPSEIRVIQSERYSGISGKTIDLSTGNRAWEEGLYLTHLDLSHTCPDWDNILTLGIPGLLRRADDSFKKSPSPFTESVKLVYSAFRDFILRVAVVSRRGGRSDLAEILDFLADNPPETLREALQLGLLYREVMEIEGEWVRSMGIFDRQYEPFFRKDIEGGRLTEESAEEMLAIYFSRFHAQSHGKDAGVPFCFGGFLPGRQDADGCNELTVLALNAFRRLGLPDPKFSFRVNPHTPDTILLQCAECIKEGKSAIVFANEVIARKTFLRCGKDQKDLANFVPIGCYEPAIMGKELSCTMTTIFNLAKIAEKLFDDAEFNPKSFDEVLSRYLELLEKTLQEALALGIPWEKLWYEINPSPLLSGTMNECMEHGLDVSQFGTKYATSGVMCAGIGTAVDALSAIRMLVFEQKKVTFAGLGKILADNWEGREPLRQQAIHRAPKWGCGNETADAIAQKITETAGNLINHTPNAKGGFYQMGLWSIDLCLTFGVVTRATADGRHAKDPISKNCGSTIACDREGVTGLIESVVKLDHTLFPDGAVLDVMLPPRTVAGPEGTNLIGNIVKTFFAEGGFYIHFNILSAKVLKAAKINPEQYRNLQIRLCGWNVRFVDLKEPMQDCLIREAESKE